MPSETTQEDAKRSGANACSSATSKPSVNQIMAVQYVVSAVFVVGPIALIAGNRGQTIIAIGCGAVSYCFWSSAMQHFRKGH